MASLESRLQALEAASRVKRGARFPRALVIYQTGERTPEQQAAIDEAETQGRAVIVLKARTFELPPEFDRIIEVPDAEREANREPDKTKIQRPDAWGR
jgi:hypothetical protein